MVILTFFIVIILIGIDLVQATSSRLLCDILRTRLYMSHGLLFRIANLVAGSTLGDVLVRDKLLGAISGLFTEIGEHG